MYTSQDVCAIFVDNDSGLCKYEFVLKRSKRKKPAVKIGKYSQKIRLSGEKLKALRQDVAERAEYRCELKLPGCWGYASWSNGEMHHEIHRSLGGSDAMENCVWSCPSCHRKAHNQ